MTIKQDKIINKGVYRKKMYKSYFPNSGKNVYIYINYKIRKQLKNAKLILLLRKTFIFNFFSFLKFFKTILYVQNYCHPQLGKIKYESDIHKNLAVSSQNVLGKKMYL